MSGDDATTKEQRFGDFSEESATKTVPWNVEGRLDQDKIRTIHYGIGAIGSEVVRAVLNNPNIEIVAAIDAHPSKAGRDLGEAADVGHTLGIPVQYEVDPVLNDTFADVCANRKDGSIPRMPRRTIAGTGRRGVCGSSVGRSRRTQSQGSRGGARTRNPCRRCRLRTGKHGGD